MATETEYIFFEPDQVLTNDHLNETFNYLDQQNRWTRNKLIGIGIACGLQLSHQAGIIQLSAGCGVTSQGYLILQPAPQPYAYIIPYTPVELPVDLPFAHTNDLPFFKPFCNGKTIFLLLTDAAYNALEDTKKAKAQTLSSQPAGFLNNYAVVLFLEADEVDLKNCDTFDCTNKGARMELQVRSLLVKKKDLPTNSNTKTNTAGSTLSHQIRLKRYNVPYADLKNHIDVIRAFTLLVDDEILQEVSNALNYCFQQYGSLFNISTNAFANLFQSLQTKRSQVLNEYPIFIQYFYDFINDLIDAYYEFRMKASDIITQCCPDENWFPLHLVLGDASKDTDVYVKDSYRRYFIYSPLFAKGINETGEGLFLYRKLEVMVKEFEVLTAALKERTQAIKITPSQYGLPLLSERAIPYYYNLTAGSMPLYKNWSYYKTSHGNAAFNQSYNAFKYNSAAVTVKPLLYDIEHYNFFRIEGHIGENYQSVLNNLINQRLEYNLPFDVVAISADLLRSHATLPQCNMQDLETDYKLIISEFACKVHTPFCFLTKFPYPPDGAITKLNQTDNLQKFSAFKMDTAQHFTALSYTISTAATYRKGDFMRRYCMPAANTIGNYYLQRLKGNSFSVDNVQGGFTSQQSVLILIYNYILAFIDAVEEIMLLLFTNSVATLSITALKEKYEVYTKALSLLTFILAEFVVGKDSENSFGKELELDMLVDEFFVLSSVCMDERLQTLIEEYRRRLFLYQSQYNFLNYFKKHPGLEHKAGVPKGGTFVIVYYDNTSYQRGEVALLNNATAIVDTAQEVNVFSGQMQAKAYYLNNDAARQITDFVENCKDAPDDSKQKIIDIINKQRMPVTDTRFSITNGAVIADFYIPYLCCSDCPPIAYILPTPAETPVFDIASKEYVFNDAHNYAFTAKPPVTDAGTAQVPFASPDVLNPGSLNLLTDANNILYLHPAMPDLDKTFKATITYKNIPLDITIIKPDATFNINEIHNPAGEILLQLMPVDLGADSYEWTLNDIPGIFQNMATPPGISLGELQQKTNNATSFVIALTVAYTRNGNLSEDTQTKEYRLAAKPVCIDFEKPVFKPETVYGPQVGQQKGDTAFTTAEKVEAKVWPMQLAGSESFGVAMIVNAPAVFNNGQSLSINNINIEFNYANSSHLPVIITFDFFDQGGIQNLSVNGSELFAGKLAGAPAQLGGVNITVVMEAGGNQQKGLVTLTGNIETPVKIFRIGGQEFFIDNVCAQ